MLRDKSDPSPTNQCVGPGPFKLNSLCAGAARTTEVDGYGRTSTHRYAGFGRLVEKTDAGGERTTCTYNRLGQKVTKARDNAYNYTNGSVNEANRLPC